MNAKPEFEDCAALARAAAIPLDRVRQEARVALHSMDLSTFVDPAGPGP